MDNTLVKLIGWRATILHGDPAVYDRWKWLRRHLTAGPLRTLDAGCGPGPYTLYAATLGNQVVGIDFNLHLIETARTRARMLGLSGVEFIEGDLRRLEELVPRLGTFDQVICFETIEHILDDDHLVRDLSRLLRPGGRLLLTTPYRHYRPLRHDRVSQTEDGGHVRWGYTHDEMRALLARWGIEVVVEEYISGLVTQQLVNLHRVLGRWGKLGWAIAFPFRLAQVVDAPVTRLARYPHLSIGVIGVKR